MEVQPTKMKAAVHFALDSGVNMLLRGFTLVSKFFLLVYLAKILAPEQLGIYGLFTVTVSYSLYLLGLDFYTYAQREMLSLPRTAWGGIINNQFMFYGVVYLVMFPLLLLVFFVGWLPWQMIGWFYLVLTFEHISQELYRLLVTCGRVTMANVTLFFRGGAWVLAVLLLFKIKPEIHSLTPIWACWSLGVAISIGIAIIAVRKEIDSPTGHIPTDWVWVRRGLKVATPFLIATLALRGLFTLDRYFLDLYEGKSAVGIYSFYMGIANAMMAFADAGIISRLYPRIIAAYSSGNYEEYRRHLKKLAGGIIILFVFFSLCLFLTIKPLLLYIGREVYLEHINTLWILLGAQGVYCLALVPHYALFAHGADQAIAVASVLSVIVFVGAAIFLIPHMATLGIALSVLCGMMCLGILKMVFYIRVSNNRIT